MSEKLIENTECEEFFNLILDVDNNSLSTTELIRYLSGTALLFTSVNHSLNKYYGVGYEQILVDVIALEKGSFKITTKIKKFSKHPMIVAGFTILAQQLFSPNTPTQNIYINNSTVEIHCEQIKANKEVVKAVSDIAKTTVDSLNIKSLKIEYQEPITNETKTSSFDKEALRGLIIESVEEKEKDTHTLPMARLVVVSPVLESSPASWKVKINNKTFSAKMTDNDFLKKMDEEKIAFAKNDILIADIETIVTKKKDNTPDVKHYIRKVYDYPKYTTREDSTEQTLLFD